MVDQQKALDELHSAAARDKADMEAKISTLEEQLTNCSLERNDAMVQLNRVQEEADHLKEELSSVQASLGSENQMDILQERFDFLQRECADKDESFAVLKAQFEKAQEEAKRRMESEKVFQEQSVAMENLKTQFDESQKADILLRAECAEKERTLAALKENFEKAQEKAGRVPDLENSVRERSLEIQTFKAQLEESQKAHNEMVSSLEERERSIASLTEQIRSLESEKQRVEDVEKSLSALTEQINSLEIEKGRSAALRDTLRNKEEDLDRLESRLHEAELCYTKVEELLKNLGLLNQQESLSSALDGIAKKLSDIVDPIENTQVSRGRGKAPLTTGIRKKKGANQERTVLSTPLRKAQQSAPHEYETTEVVYRQRRIRRSISLSPRKSIQPAQEGALRTQKQAADPDNSIRPFSQVQWDLSNQGQSSPLSQLTDLGSLFSPSPENAKSKHVGRARGNIWKVKSVTLPQKSDGSRKPSRKLRKDTTLEVPATQPDGEDSGVEFHGEKISSQHAHPLTERDINVSVIPSSQTRMDIEDPGCRETSKTGNIKVCPGSLNGNEDMNPLQTHSQSHSQNQRRKIQPKGILKGVATPSSTREQSIARTPMREQKIGRSNVERQPSRTSSSWFDIPVSPIATRSGVTLGGKRNSQAMDHSTDNGGPQLRPKARRRNKGKSNRCSKHVFTNDEQEIAIMRDLVRAPNRDGQRYRTFAKYIPEIRDPTI